MATVRIRERKDGTKFYEIRASRTRGDETPPTMRWTIPDGWAQKSIDRELAKVAAEFDRQYKAGEVVSGKERKAQERAKAEADAKVQTVRKYTEEVYLPQKAQECKGNTAYYYRQFICNFILPAIGDKKITEVDSVDLQKILLRAQKNGYRYATTSGLYKTMAQVFRMAYRHDLIPRNPMDKVDHPKRRKDEAKNEKETFTAEELRMIRAYLEGETLQWRALFNVLIDSGIRRGEACGLRWSSIDEKTGKVRIDRNIVCTSDEKGWIETTTKSGKERCVLISPATVKLLQALRMEQRKAGYLSPYVFLKRGTGDPLRPDSVTAFAAEFEKRHGIAKRCNPHNFRHTFATLAIAKGANPTDVSKALGHADLTTTFDFYVHVDEDAGVRVGNIFMEAVSS